MAHNVTMISTLNHEHQGSNATGSEKAPTVRKAASQKPGAIPARFEQASAIVERHGHKACRLVPILQEVQEAYRYLPKDILTHVAHALNIAPARVFGVATFYAHFAIEPKGKHLVRLCDGTACHVKDSIPILDAIRKSLCLEGRATTTPDLKFTVETVACLGACGLAPVVVADEQVYGAMTPAKGTALIEEMVAKEAAT
jgi:NADH-quinone oxidoreductase subunit E